MLRVFISSEMRSGRLRRERLAAASVVERHPAAEPWLWERHAKAGRYSAFEVCVGTAKTSDILLLILADELTDVTEAEWRAAKAGGANCALLVKDPPTLSSRAQAFVAAERSDCISAPYADLPGLRRAVQDALTQCMTDAVRQRALARRARETRDSPSRMHLLEAGVDRAGQFYGSGAIENAKEVLDEIDALFGAYDERPEDLDLISGLVAGASGHGSKAAAAYIRVIRSTRSSNQVKALAYQNLGIEAMRAGQLKTAASYMRSAFRRHRTNGDWFGVLQVALNIGNLALTRGQPETAAAMADLADQMIPFFRPPVPLQRASAKGLRAQIAAQLGKHEEALAGFKAAHAAFKRLGDVDGQIVGCQNIAISYRELGRLQLSRSWVAKGVALANGRGPTWRREELHRLAAVIACDAGRLPEALDHFEQARALAAQMGDSWRVATLTADIGAVLAEMGPDGALGELDRARKLLEAEHDYDWIVRVGMNRALVATRAGETAEAVRILSELTDIAQASRSARSGVFERLASMQLDAGQPKDAARSFKNAFALQPRTPDSAIVAGLYARELEYAGAHSCALQLFDLALRRARTGDDAGLVYDVASDRALLLAAMGKAMEALAELESCLKTARELRDTERVVRALHNIGELSRRVGDNRRSLSALRQACSIAKRTGDETAHRAAMGLLAITQAAVGRFGDAETTSLTLRDFARTSRDRANEAVALGVLGSCAFARGDYAAAAEFYRAASRSHKDDPVHRAEDLCGLIESHAAANRWRPTLRAAQALVTHAQDQACEAVAWPSLLRAARWYLDRDEQRRAGILTAPAWVLASQSKSERSVANHGKESTLEDSQFMEAIMTTAFHELWSGSAPCDGLYKEVICQFELGKEDAGLQLLIDEAREIARQTP